MTSDTPSPSPSKPSLGPVLLAVFLDLLGFGLVIPLLSFYAEDYSATPVQVTLLMAVYSVAQFFGAPVWGLVSDRIGRRPVMLVSVAASAFFLACFAAAQTLTLLFVFRALHGLAAANISTAQAYVADVTSGEDRAKGMGLIGAAFGVGFSLGPFIGGQLSPWGLAAPIWLAAGLSALNFVWIFLRLPESHPPAGAVQGAPVEAAQPHARRTLNPGALLSGLRHPVVGMAIFLMFVATFAFSMMEATFSLVAEHVWSMNARQVGNLFGLIGGIGIVIQGGLVGRLAKRFGEPRLVSVGYLLNAAGMGILAMAGPGSAVWMGCAVMAAGSSLATPSLNALISKGTAESEQGAVLGVSQSFSALARATAPALGGAIYATWRPGGAMAVGAMMMLAALAISLPATRRAGRGRAGSESAASSPG